MTTLHIVACLMLLPPTPGAKERVAELERTYLRATSVEQCQRDYAPGIQAACALKYAADAAAVKGRVVARCQGQEAKQ